MKKKHILWVAALIGAVAVLSMPGCEDSDLTAPTDGIMELAVNPSTLEIDPNLGESEASAQVIATLFSSEGKPLQGVSVLFTTARGTLASAGTTVKTNASGAAIDTLTVTHDPTQPSPSEPTVFDVRAQSSAIVTTTEVTLVIGPKNEQPLASFIETPAGSAQVGEVVQFDGTTSLDPDGEITCYQWTITSSEPASTEVVQGTVASFVERTYDKVQTLQSVVLRVSDRADAGTQCDGGAVLPDTMFSPNVDSISNYEIECANPPPVADAGPDIDRFFNAGTFPSEFVTLDGRFSTDDRGIRSYVWSCPGAKQGPIPTTTDGVVFCQYEGFNSTGWEARLEVTDVGDSTGQCEKKDQDTVRIRFLESGSNP